MRVKRAFLIHGWGGHPDEGWQPWLRQELEKRGWQVAIPAMPDTDHPQCDAWVWHLRETIGKPDEDCVLVGHSLGCVTILRYLETLMPSQYVGGAVLVASFFEDLGPRYSELHSFVDRPVHWETVRRSCGHFSVIHSDDDTVVLLPFAERVAKNLNCPVTLVHGQKHFSGNDGTFEAPDVLKAILDAAIPD